MKEFFARRYYSLLFLAILSFATSAFFFAFCFTKAFASQFADHPIEYIVMSESEEIQAASHVFERSKKWLQNQVGAKAFGGIRDLDVGFQAYKTGKLDTRTAKQFALEHPELYIEPNYTAHHMEYIRGAGSDRNTVPIDELAPPGGNDDDDDDDDNHQPSQKTSWGVEFIGAKAAWEITRGEGIRVAIVDSGVDVDHPDLPGLLDNETAVPDEPADDLRGHGTHVAGIIAALDNQIGYVGASPKVGIGSFKGLNKSGTGKYAWLAEMMKAAGDSETGYHIINNSWGGTSPSELLDRTGKAIKEKGIIQVCAAGNSGHSVIWPARYDWCLAVASSYQRDGKLDKSGFSSWGKQIVTMVPGSVIPSTVPGGGYDHKSGTSMASPLFASYLALALAAGVDDVVFEILYKDEAKTEPLPLVHQGWGHPRSDWTVLH